MENAEEQARQKLNQYGLGRYVRTVRVFARTADFVRYITENRVFFRANGKVKRWAELLPEEQDREWAAAERVARFAEAETFVAGLNPMAVQTAFNLERLQQVWEEVASVRLCSRAQRFEHAVLHEGIHARDFVQAETAAFDFHLIRPFTLTAEVLALRGVYAVYRQKSAADMHCYLDGYLSPLLEALFTQRLNKEKELSMYEFGQIAGIGLVFADHGVAAETEFVEDLYDQLVMELLVPEFSRITAYLRDVKRITVPALREVEAILAATEPLVHYRLQFGAQDE